MEEQRQNKRRISKEHLELSSEERNETDGGGHLVLNPLSKYLSRSEVQTVTGCAVKTLMARC